MMDVSKNISAYLKDRNPELRYASFDYCFNYFKSFYENGKVEEIASQENLQMSCLQLGFYLASWGMLRGSTFLLQKSVKHFEALIKEVASMDTSLWEIDVDLYSSENIDIILTTKNRIRKQLGDKSEYASDTLISKIMLGVFGNVPAFDQNFCTGFGMNKSLIKNNLLALRDYYKDYRNEINGQKIRTIDFETGKETNRFYTKAKIIDMVGFIEGMKTKI
jgi:hypothetical protein